MTAPIPVDDEDDFAAHNRDPANYRLRTLGRALAGGKGADELAPGADPELREHAIQVRADRAVGQIEALPDFAVREALRGELRDLKFLGGQLVACGWVAPAARLSRRSQFDAGLVSPGCASHCFERGAGVSQR